MPPVEAPFEPAGRATRKGPRRANLGVGTANLASFVRSLPRTSGPSHWQPHCVHGVRVVGCCARHNALRSSPRPGLRRGAPLPPCTFARTRTSLAAVAAVACPSCRPPCRQRCRQNPASSFAHGPAPSPDAAQPPTVPLCLPWGCLESSVVSTAELLPRPEAWDVQPLCTRTTQRASRRARTASPAACDTPSRTPPSLLPSEASSAFEARGACRPGPR